MLNTTAILLAEMYIVPSCAPDRRSIAGAVTDVRMSAPAARGWRLRFGGKDSAAAPMAVGGLRGGGTSPPSVSVGGASSADHDSGPSGRPASGCSLSVDIGEPPLRAIMR